MINTSQYNDGIDEIWHNSSTIVYTKFIENPNDNSGNLYVTFKGGSTYLYKDVELYRYIQFKQTLGLEDNSSGKALNMYIKPYYQFEKQPNMLIEDIDAKLQMVKEEQSTLNKYFISGHRDITEDEFETYYVPLLDEYASYETSRFVVGDYYGADIMAQNYLVDSLHIDPNRITVYHMMESPRNINPKITKTKGGFQSDDERDTAMTKASEADIAFIRPGKEKSGTAQNILRRHLMA